MNLEQCCGIGRSDRRGCSRRRRGTGGFTLRAVIGTAVIRYPAIWAVTTRAIVVGAVRVGIVLRWRGVLVEDVLELLVRRVGVVEGVAAPAVGQGQARRHPHVLFGDDLASTPRCVGGGGAGHHQVAPHPVDVEGGADLGDLQDGRVRKCDVRQPGFGGLDSLGEGAFLLLEVGEEPGRVGLVGQASADDFDPGGRLPARGDVDGQPEAVEQLWP